MGQGAFGFLLLVFTVCYIASPIDIIPDFIPLIGWLDDLLVLSGTTVATFYAVRRHWLIGLAESDSEPNAVHKSSRDDSASSASGEPQSSPRARSSRTAIIVSFLVCLTVVSLGVSGLVYKAWHDFWYDNPVRKIAAVATATKEMVKKAEHRTFQPAIVLTALGESSSRGKLVVFTQEVTTQATIESDRRLTEKRYVPGTQRRLTILAEGNRFQYYVPVHQISENNFSMEEELQRLHVRLPEPLLDEEMVSIQSDPAKIMVESTGGLLTFGDDRVEIQKAQAALKPAVLKQARAASVKKQANEGAREVMTNLLRDVLRGTGYDSPVIIFEDSTSQRSD